jgi:hypothetical protein
MTVKKVALGIELQSEPELTPDVSGVRQALPGAPRRAPKLSALRASSNGAFSKHLVTTRCSYYKVFCLSL